MAIQIDHKRLSEITEFKSGAHKSIASGACVMEAVSYIAGEPWSDHPECVCPVIAAFMRSWNDALPDDERTALLMPLMTKVVGTRSTKEVEERRSYMAVDWFIRVHTPAWLKLAGLKDQAALIEALPEITGFAQIPSIRAPLEAVRRDAAAARDAAWDAARAAAWDAARDAARDAAGAAAWDAARDAAGAAAWAAAWDAAWDALSSTKAELQASAVQLIERMCAVEA